MADDPRPEYQHGVGTIGSTQFHWGSGMPGKYWSIPYGDYPVTPNAPTGAWAHQAGAIPIANNVIPDPQLGRNRIGIMIHSVHMTDDVAQLNRLRRALFLHRDHVRRRPVRLIGPR